jgi:predicted ferric reductase
MSWQIAKKAHVIVRIVHVVFCALVIVSFTRDKLTNFFSWPVGFFSLFLLLSMCHQMRGRDFRLKKLNIMLSITKRHPATLLLFPTSTHYDTNTMRQAIQGLFRIILTNLDIITAVGILETPGSEGSLFLLFPLL